MRGFVTIGTCEIKSATETAAKYVRSGPDFDTDAAAVQESEEKQAIPMPNVQAAWPGLWSFVGWTITVCLPNISWGML